MGERRRSVRQKSFLRGCIYFNKRRNSADCLIRDISETGARVIFSATVSLPEIVELYVPQKEQTLRAQVQWRHGDELGLAFPDADGAAAARPQFGELAQRVAQLESEIGSLRRALKQMKKGQAGPGDTEAA